MTDYEPTQGGIATEPSEPATSEPTETPKPSAEREALVRKLLEKIRTHEKRYEKKFKQMREDMKLTRRGASKDWDTDNKYTANLIQRHVKQRVSALYAKNPTVKARRRQTQDFMLWDGNIETAKAAITAVSVPMVGGIVADPAIAQQAQELLADIAQGRERQKMIDSIGRTLELCYTHYMNEGQPPFKLRAKQLIRRTVTCSVGYVKLGYQRVMGRNADWNAKMADTSQRLEHLQRLADDAAKDGNTPDQAEIEELTLSMTDLQSQPEVVLREGLIFDFPRSYDIIPIGDCVELKGFVGCEAVAQRMLFQPDKIKEIYDKDIKGQYTQYARTGQKKAVDGEDDFVTVFEYYDKPSGLMYTLADGYCDFLEEPHAPPAQIEQFFPFFVISFNDIEDEDDLFPPSDPELLRHQQMEYNRSREALRQHRIANQPNYAAPAGAFPDWSDEHKLMSAIPHEILKLNALAPGQKVGDVIQPIQKVAIDPALYDTQFIFDDILRTVGSQEANLGGTTGSTATESSIAENSRAVAQNSEIDDVDDMLSQLARAGGQILLKELSAETARKIAGPGAKWPELSSAEIAEELYLDIEAGSSGKPNKAVELANWERLMPLLIQVPGVSPAWVAKESIKRLDDRADLAEAMLDGAPSIMAMNAAEKAASSNPEDQGPMGGDNAERAPGTAGGAQANMGPDGTVPQGAMAVGGAPGQPGQPMQPGMPGQPQPGMPGQPPQMRQQISPEGQPVIDGMGQPVMEPVPMPPQVGMAPPPDPMAQTLQALQAASEQFHAQGAQHAQQMAAAVQQAGQDAVAGLQQTAQAVSQAMQQTGTEAVAAIQQAAGGAVAGIQQAANTAAAQLSANAAMAAVQAVAERVAQPQPPAPPSAIDQLLAERLTRLTP